MQKSGNRFLNEFKLYYKHGALTLMLLPTILYFIIFKYIPMSGIVMAFKDYNLSLGIWGSPWVGFQVFSEAFATETFIRAVKNTLVISFWKILIGFPAPIVLALLLNEVRHLRYKKIVQTVSYLPHFLSWIIVAGLCQQMLSPTTGAVNHMLVNWFGMKEPIYFLGDNNYFRGVLIITDIWKDVGWGSILYIATIAGIDPSLYEAAVCDGATRFQRLRHITLPSIIPTITIMLIMRVGSVLDAGFDQIFNLYNTAVYPTGDIIDTYVYRYGLGEMKYPLGTAIGLFKNIIGFILVVTTNAITTRLNGSGIW